MGTPPRTSARPICGRVEALLRLLAESGQPAAQRGPREYTVGNAGIYIKTADKEHLSGRDVFWGGIPPGVDADFRRRNATQGKCGAWAFVSPTEEADTAQFWLVPGSVVESFIERWVARFGGTQAQLHVHIQMSDDGRFQLRGAGEQIDVTAYHVRFPVTAAAMRD